MKSEDGASGEDSARLNRVSARQGFGEDDPRRGPFDEAEARRARAYLDAPDRWHAIKKDVDLYAVRLQFGRGVRKSHAARMFAICETVITKRQGLKPRLKWISCMSERDRRNLSREVWLGGLLRLSAPGREVDEAMLGSLKAASEWKRIEDEPAMIWLAEDQDGEHAPMTVHTDIADDDLYTDRDPYRHERAAMWGRLEAELDAVEAAADAEYDARADAAHADAGVCEAEVPDVLEPGGDREAVEAVGG
jgi:hypothetical protein